jgi:hypothetical protein
VRTDWVYFGHTPREIPRSANEAIVAMNSEETSATGQDRRAVERSEQAYTFGRPLSTYLSPHEIVRLTIVRFKIREARGEVGPMRTGGPA